LNASVCQGSSRIEASLRQQKGECDGDLVRNLFGVHRKKRPFVGGGTWSLPKSAFKGGIAAGRQAIGPSALSGGGLTKFQIEAIVSGRHQQFVLGNT